MGLIVIYSSAMTVEAIGAYYDKMAKEGYDDIYGNVVCKAEDIVLISYIRRGFKGGNVLDIGCGTGLISSYLDEKVYYSGLDVSFQELRSAVDKETHKERAYIQADMHNIPLRDETFDLIISAYGPYSYSLEPKKLYREFLRVLKPGGKFVVMPYTERTGKSIGLGGFSTAVEPSIPKLFYKQEVAEKVFSNLSNLEVFGLNYLPNLVLPKVNSGQIKGPITDSVLKAELIGLSEEIDTPVDFSNLKHSQALLKLWNKFVADQTNTKLLAALISREIVEYKDTVPAHMARHMLVIGEKPIK